MSEYRKRTEWKPFLFLRDAMRIIDEGGVLSREKSMQADPDTGRVDQRDSGGIRG